MVRLPQETVSALESFKARGYWMLGGFELESSDHLQKRLDVTSEDRAKKRITDAVRELQFGVATGLRRMRKVADKRKTEFMQLLPGTDHMSLWVEPGTGRWLALDEPYHSRYSSNETRRGQWITERSLVTTAPAWDGLYSPGNSIPHLVSADLDLLQRTTDIVEQLDSIPAIDWDTYSAGYMTYFRSPLRVASGKPYRPRPQASYGKRAGAVAYGGRPGEASDWRPAQSMPLKQHQALGVVLRGLSRLDLSVRTHDKLSASISTLDDWSVLEHPGESSHVLTDLYYGDERARYEGLDKQLLGVSQARTLILAGYNECRPRRDLLKVLDAIERDVLKRAEKRTAKR